MSYINPPLAQPSTVAKSSTSAAAAPPNTGAEHNAGAARATRSITVRLTDEDTAGLDEIALRIRRTSGKAVNRSSIIRGFLDALLRYPGTFARCGSEAEISARILQIFEMARSKPTAPVTGKYPTPAQGGSTGTR
jgi:hypothetical protein